MISPLNCDKRSSCWPMLIVSSKHCLHFKFVSPSSSAVSMKHNPLGSLVDNKRISAATNWLFSNLIISPTLKIGGMKSIMLLGSYSWWIEGWFVVDNYNQYTIYIHSFIIHTCTPDHFSSKSLPFLKVFDLLLFTWESDKCLCCGKHAHYDYRNEL